MVLFIAVDYAWIAVHCVLYYLGSSRIIILNDYNVLRVGVYCNVAKNMIKARCTRRLSTKPPYNNEEPEYDHKENNVP